MTIADTVEIRLATSNGLMSFPSVEEYARFIVLGVDLGVNYQFEVRESMNFIYISMY